MAHDTLRLFIRELYNAYEHLLMEDPRVNPVLRDQLLASTRPQVMQVTFHEIQQRGGSNIDYILEETLKIGGPIVRLVAQGQQGNTNVALVPMDRDQIERYARSFHRLEVLFKILHEYGKR